MDPKILCALNQLSNHELLERVKTLAEREREATASVIAHLAELDARQLYLAEGYSSLFAYCTQELSLSESAAFRRIVAARTIRRFPGILEMLEQGWVNLTTVRLLADHLTEENHQEVLDAARLKSKRQVEELIARLHPLPPSHRSFGNFRLQTVSVQCDQPRTMNSRIYSPQGMAKKTPLKTCRLSPPRPPEIVQRLSSPWRQSVTRFSSRQAPKLTRSFASRRISCVIRFPTEIQQKSLTWR
jgi:hypothetical protein